ncbi:MAG: hypothetical protein ICV75_07365 [Nitrospiraceae bacterium]|nr:hypothetical protein [Nitrospiraceae bacterium]
MNALSAWYGDAVEEGISETAETGRQDRRLRRYSLIVTVGMIVLCNAIFLLGIWGSGVNLDDLIRIPDLFNPMKDICVRLKWQKIEGDNERVQLCSEWINLSDPSGNTHSLHKETEVFKGGNGKLYFNHGVQVDYRLFLFLAFVVAVFVFGFMLRRYLIRRYRMRLLASIGNHSHLLI